MFTADLSWADPNEETIGQRRERKAHQRAMSKASSSNSHGISQRPLARGPTSKYGFSIFGGKKNVHAISIKEMTWDDDLASPKTSVNNYIPLPIFENVYPQTQRQPSPGSSSSKASAPSTPSLSPSLTSPWSDAVENRGRNLSKTSVKSASSQDMPNSAKLIASGTITNWDSKTVPASFKDSRKKPEEEYEAEKIIYKVQASSVGSVTQTRETRTTAEGYKTIVEPTVEPLLSASDDERACEAPSDFRRRSFLPYADHATEVLSPLEDPNSVLKGPGSPDLSTWKVAVLPVTSLKVQPSSPSRTPLSPQSSLSNIGGPAAPSTWKPPTDWETITEEERCYEENVKVRPARKNSHTPIIEVRPQDENSYVRSVTKICHTPIEEESQEDLTPFQRFIHRMESAGSKIILDALQEEWDEPDEDARDEMELEKQLWALTALQLLSVKASRPMNGDQTEPHADNIVNGRGKILELYGNRAEAYQISAMAPSSRIHYLSPNPPNTIPLPSNLSYLTVPSPDILPFPFPESSFTHIRSTALPSLIQSNKFPPLFKECHRVLASDGVLELRILDPMPIKSTTGPKLRAWIEEHVLVNLEKKFRCSRPGILVPSWIKDAGFKISPSLSDSKERAQRFPAMVKKKGGSKWDLDEELRMVVGRILWKDLWGSFVEGEKYWWEEKELTTECEQMGTMFECFNLFATKDMNNDDSPCW
ncbi:MAG: hypothetical protein M1834_002964 [Cirrosporium novae-zelandiae]|nr:MAG: hypothetical protein M1834_002964 [Cirrosporium novae-zelandiae]